MKKAKKTTIKGKPYKVTPNEFGWGVTNTTTPTNNFHRSYQVYAGDDGRPARCSCPHNAKKGGTCKHMIAVAELVEREDGEVGVWFLEHPSKPRCYRFAKLTSGAVRYERWEGRLRTSSQTLPVEDARKCYAWLTRSGYSKFGFISRGR